MAPWPLIPSWLVAILIERVLAVVAGHPITLSEVELEARIALAMRGGGQAMQVKLEPDVLCATLEMVINEYLISAEADRLRLPATSELELRQAMTSFRMRFSSQDEFERFVRQLELTPGDIVNVLARHLRVEALMASRLAGRARRGAAGDGATDRPGGWDKSEERRAADTALLRAWLADIAGRFPIRLTAGAVAASSGTPDASEPPLCPHLSIASSHGQ